MQTLEEEMGEKRERVCNLKALVGQVLAALTCTQKVENLHQLCLHVPGVVFVSQYEHLFPGEYPEPVLQED